MFIAPIYLYKVAKIYFNQHEDPDVQITYKKLFKGFKLESFPQLNYALVFILRRYVMVLVLTVLPTQRNIQINIQLISTLFVMSYPTYVLPFESMI